MYVAGARRLTAAGAKKIMASAIARDDAAIARLMQRIGLKKN